MDNDGILSIAKLPKPDADLYIARGVAAFIALKDDRAEAIIVEISDALKGWQNFVREQNSIPAVPLLRVILYFGPGGRRLEPDTLK